MLSFPSPLFGKADRTPTATSWFFATTAGNVGSEPESWSTPSNAFADDGVFTIVSMSGSSPYPTALRLNTFGLAAASIPSTATISGIEIEVERANTGSTGNGDYSLTWVDSYLSPSVVSTNFISDTTSDFAGVKTFGSPNTVNGALTKAIAEAASFAILLRPHGNLFGGACVLKVDYVKIRLFYYT